MTTISQGKSTKSDPRIYQITILTGLLIYGLTSLDLEIDLVQSVVVISVSLLAQFLLGRTFGLPTYDPKSPLISALSLCLLLRTNNAGLAVVAAVVTIASKFVLRFRGKHIFNPTNFGLTMIMLVTPAVWVSAGQWGSMAITGFFIACVGGMVVNRAARSDITFSFLGAFALLLFGRALWLGDPLVIPIRQVQNGAFLIFAFFMLSDPKTTPNSRTGRILYAFLVALGGFIIQFILYENNGLLWSLVVCSITVPLFDRFIPGSPFRWPGTINKIDDRSGGSTVQHFTIQRLNG